MKGQVGQMLPVTAVIIGLSLAWGVTLVVDGGTWQQPLGTTLLAGGFSFLMTILLQTLRAVIQIQANSK